MYFYIIRYVNCMNDGALNRYKSLEWFTEKDISDTIIY